tara:strand:- start:1574 stop:2365 length:792 start_codon:yes stop_codon:yes gene_type:complete
MKRSLKFAFLLVFLLSILAGYSLISPYNYQDVELSQMLLEPSTTHLLGTDELGRDILTRLSYAVRTSLFVGAFVMVISVLVGCTIGSLSGYIGGKFDLLVMRIADVFLAFPGILLAIAFSALVGNGFTSVITALCLFSWVGFALMSRTQVLEIKNKPFIESAQMAGVGKLKIVFRHLLPNIATIIIVESCFVFSGAIISEAGLSFLGIGIQAPDASLGIMLKQGMAYMLVSPHMILVPAITLLIIVLMINLFSDKLTQVIAKH